MIDKPPPPERVGVHEPSTAELFREALDEAKELARLEIEIARSEVEMEIARAKRAAIGVGIALAAGVLVMCVLAMALVLALGGTALTALGVAGVMLLVGGAAAIVAYAVAPKRPLEHTKEELRRDVGQLKEHMA
jgi:uncharacterized membrane protein YqjE